MKKPVFLHVAALTLAATLAGTAPVQAAELNFQSYNFKYGTIIVGTADCGQFPSFPDLKPGNTPEDKPENKPADTPESKPDNGTDSDSTRSYAEQVVDLVNKERAKEGLAPLTIDTGLEQAALVRSKEIQTNFSHTRPNGSSFATAVAEAGVTYRRTGENIAWGQKTPEAVVNAWMNSEGHRANIMNVNFSRIGVGYLTNASGTPYWTQLFAN